jgi:O-antigen/teichoic acid export membrane protein
MIVAIIVYILFILYLSWQLFRFASLAGKQEFFNLDNRKRLRLFGGFLLVISLLSFLLARCDIFLMEWLTGTTGFIRQQSAPGFQFPEMLIAGMLMFIIAEAFAKGQRLQTEQDLTI